MTKFEIQTKLFWYTLLLVNADKGQIATHLLFHACALVTLRSVYQIYYVFVS